MIQKYASAILSIVITLVAVLATTDHVNVVVAWQLAALAVSGIGVYWVPLLKGAWSAGLKTGVEIAGAIFTAAAPFVIAGHITGPQVALVVLAALKVLGTELGVQLRKDVYAPAA